MGVGFQLGLVSMDFPVWSLIGVGFRWTSMLLYNFFPLHFLAIQTKVEKEYLSFLFVFYSKKILCDFFRED